MSDKCRQCGQALHPVIISDIHGNSGQSSVTFSGLTALACPSAHERHWAHPEFGSMLTDDLFFSKLVPISQTKWFRQSCRRCGERLDGQNLRLVDVSGEIVLEELSPIRVRVQALGKECGQCADVQIYGSRLICGEVGNAVSNAFETASLMP